MYNNIFIVHEMVCYIQMYNTMSKTRKKKPEFFVHCPTHDN